MGTGGEPAGQAHLATDEHVVVAGRADVPGCCLQLGAQDAVPVRPGEVHAMTACVARCDYCGNWFPVAAATGYCKRLPAPAQKEP
jgi:hypothetical protein